MDYSILYMLLVVVIVVGLTALAVWLRKKNLVKPEDLLFVITILDISVEVIDDLNLSREPQIKLIAEIVRTALDYVIKNMMNDPSTDKVELATQYAIDLAEKSGIKLTEQRINIIRTLVELSFASWVEQHPEYKNKMGKKDKKAKR